MGVDFYCGDCAFHCSYSGWDNIRRQIMKSCFDYITDKFAKDQANFANVTIEEDDTGENTSYHHHMNNIKPIIAIVETESVPKSTPDICATNIMSFIKSHNNDVGVFIRACDKFYSSIDSLIYFNINGLYALCNKSDCEGYYSPGNSSDICQLLDLIKPFIKVNDEYIYERIYEGDLYRLFTESATKRLIVTIC
jgi:hypothetical protein